MKFGYQIIILISGEDSESGRDSGSDGAGVDNLVENAVKDMLSGRDLSPWDFDNNGIVDRLLILHSANPQEISGGSSSIWSHMSGLDNPVKIGKWSINHYTIASTKSGVGTIVHEMLHQMGLLTCMMSTVLCQLVIGMELVYGELWLVVIGMVMEILPLFHHLQL